VLKEVKGDGSNTLGIYIGWSTGGLQANGALSMLMKSILTMELTAKIGRDLNQTLCGKLFFEENVRCGWQLNVEDTWDKLIGPNGRLFTDGVMKVEVKLTLCKQQVQTALVAVDLIG